MNGHAVAGVLAVLVAIAASADPPSSVAGGQFRIAFRQPVDSLHAEISLTPIACTLAADRRHALCEVPTTLGPGHREFDVEFTVAGVPFSEAVVVALRMPNVVSIEPRVVRAGERFELTLDAPLPNDEPFELWLLESGSERLLQARMLRATRMEAWLPPGPLPRAPLLVLRSHGEESRQFAGLLVDPERSLTEWLPYGLGLGCVALGWLWLRSRRRPLP